MKLTPCIPTENTKSCLLPPEQSVCKRRVAAEAIKADNAIRKRLFYNSSNPPQATQEECCAEIISGSGVKYFHARGCIMLLAAVFIPGTS